MNLTKLRIFIYGHTPFYNNIQVQSIILEEGNYNISQLTNKSISEERYFKQKILYCIIKDVS